MAKTRLRICWATPALLIVGCADGTAPPEVPLRPALPARVTVQTCLPTGVFPDKLSATGCYADMGKQVPGPDLIPYEVNSPLWTDGAVKRRWLVVPPGQRIAFTPDGGMDMPEGSAIVKEFRIEFVAGDTASQRPVETRLMSRKDGTWAFASYEWNTDGTEAARVEKQHSVSLDLRDNGSASHNLSYSFPATDDCTICHGKSVNQVLGPTHAQLSRKFRFGDRVMNQMAALAEIGLFDGEVAEAPPSAILPNPRDESIPLEARARSYLHANCAHCHQPGGWAPRTLTMDLRYARTLAETRICGVRTQYFRIGPRIAPGDPASSQIWRRISTDGIWRMPSIGASEIDPAIDVVRRWIESISSCPS